jgi:catechol 2,3-dioxygenase-like lactoylglutathione lyase family enzyme
MNDIAIAHLTIEVRRPARWRTLLDTLTRDNGRVTWTDEDLRGSLRIRQGSADDVVLLGLAFPTEAALSATLDRCTAAGVAWEEVAPPTNALRAVRCMDPAGTPLELLVLAPGSDPRWPIGHVALAYSDPALLEQFYADVVGMRCNERLATKAGPLELRGSFMGSARYHHALAIVNVPGKRRLNHVMFSAPDVMHVVESWHRAREAGVRFTMDLGRHPLPDGTVSFYATSPSGFDVEIGAGGDLLDGRALAEVPQATTSSSWGHEVSLRARLRVATAMLFG